MKVSDLLINKALLMSRIGPPRTYDGLLAIPYDFDSPSTLIKTKEDAYMRGWEDALNAFASSCMRIADMDPEGLGDKNR